MEVRHWQNETGNHLRVRNLYETRRMLYTLYNAIGDNPATWENGAPKLNAKGIFPVYINLSIPDDLSYQMFWPWRASESLICSIPCHLELTLCKLGMFTRMVYIFTLNIKFM